MNTHLTIMLTSGLSYESIQISSQKAQKHGSKGLSRVITWPGYKRNVICGELKSKNPIIEEHSLYQQLWFITFPTNHYNPWWLTTYPITLTTYSIVDLCFFLFLLFFFFKFTNFENSKICTIQCCQVTLTISPWFLTSYTSLSPQLKHNKTLIECSLSKGKGQSTKRLRVQQSKISKS